MAAASAQLRQWIAASVVSMSLLITGMFVGWPSPVVSKLLSPWPPLDLSGTHVSWMVSLLFVGGAISPLPAGRLMDVFGRRRVLQVASTLALVSWLLLAFTRDATSIYVARVLGGMFGGASYCITPVYLSEIAEPRIRGALNTMFTLMLYLGIMFEYCVGPLLSYTHLCLVSACVPFVFFSAMAVIPESPYFFLMKQNKDDARGALSWLRCTPDVGEELSAINTAVTTAMHNQGTWVDLIRTPAVRRALFMSEMAAFLQRMSGSSVMMAYASSSLPEDGLVSGDQCAVVMCSIWLVFGVGSTLLVDRLGRRPLLALSCAGCGLSTAGLTAWFYLSSKTSLELHNYRNVPVACFALYSLFFPFGLACIPSIVQGELFPSNVKALASGLTSIVVGVVSFVTNKLYQPLSDSWGTYTNYLYFTAASLYGIYFSLGVLVETRNKTLQEIHLELTNFGDPKESSNR